MESTTITMAPNPGQPLQSSSREWQGGAKNLPVSTLDDTLSTTQTCIRPSLSENLSNLEPFEGFQDAKHQSKPTRKYKNDRKIHKLIYLEDMFSKEPYYAHIFNITFPGIDITKDLNVIRCNNELLQTIGKPKKIVKSNKNTLLIETSFREQTQALLKISKLADHAVEIREHPFLNTIKGVARSGALGICTEEEIMERLKEQGVVFCRRLRLRRDGSVVPTDTYFFTFALMEKPAFLKIPYWHHELVHPYQEKPRQCLNCQCFSHIAKYYLRTVPTCCRCGEEGHRQETCTNAVCCFHCREGHFSNYRRCDKFQQNVRF